MKKALLGSVAALILAIGLCAAWLHFHPDHSTASPASVDCSTSNGSATVHATSLARQDTTGRYVVADGTISVSVDLYCMPNGDALYVAETGGDTPQNDALYALDNNAKPLYTKTPAGSNHVRVDAVISVGAEGDQQEPYSLVFFVANPTGQHDLSTVTGNGQQPFHLTELFQANEFYTGQPNDAIDSSNSLPLVVSHPKAS